MSAKNGENSNEETLFPGKRKEELKGIFVNGRIPNETDFAILIDSMVNQLDEGFTKDENKGFIFIPSPDKNKILTFMKDVSEKQSFFSFEKDENKSVRETNGSPVLKYKETATAHRPANNGYLRLNPDEESHTLSSKQRSFYFQKSGAMGIGKTCDDNLKMEVAGFFASEGRIGSFEADKIPEDSSDKIPDNDEVKLPGQVPADGKWHKIVGGLNNCNAFEIIARTGMEGEATGKYALLHAIALSCFGRSGGRIRKTSSYYGSFWRFWNRITLKWQGTAPDYSLWIKTCSFYGKKEKIFFRITKLWDDVLFTEPGYYYDINMIKTKK